MIMCIKIKYPSRATAEHVANIFVLRTGVSVGVCVCVCVNAKNSDVRRPRFLVTFFAEWFPICVYDNNLKRICHRIK